MQKSLSVCLLAAAASAQTLIVEKASRDFGDITGVGNATLDINVQVALGAIVVEQQIGFTKDTDWSGDAAEEVEVLYCDVNLFDNSKRDCFLNYVEDPSTKAKINAEVWQAVAFATTKTAIPAMTKDKTLRQQMKDAFGNPTCKYNQIMTGSRDVSLDGVGTCLLPPYVITDDVVTTVTAKSFNLKASIT